MSFKSSGTYVIKSFRDRELNVMMPTLALAKVTVRDLARMPLRWSKEEVQYSADAPARTTYYSDGDYYIELRS